MATLVFRLKYVPEEEADDIRLLLTDHDIGFYETSAGRWQVSLAGLWVKDKEQAAKARELISADQAMRAESMRSISVAQWLIGLLQHARENPIESMFSLLAVMLVAGLSIAPFMLWL